MIPTLKDIRLAVCLNFNMTEEKLDCADRCRKYARPRQIAMYLARELTGLSYPQIATAFGGRDHTTAMSARKRILALQESNEYVAAHVKDCRIMLNAVTAHRAIKAGGLRMLPLVQARAA